MKEIGFPIATSTRKLDLSNRLHVKYEVNLQIGLHFRIFKFLFRFNFMPLHDTTELQSIPYFSLLTLTLPSLPLFCWLSFV